MSIKHVKYGIGLIFAIIVGWDIYLALDGEKHNTISAVTLDYGLENPWFAFTLVFGVGFLMGHLVWSQKRS